MSAFPNLSKTSTEKSAKTVDEAIVAALQELGAAKDDVTVDIIEEGKSGFFGIGRKDAVVRVSLKANVIEAAKAAAEKPAAEKPVAPKSEPAKPKQEASAKITELKGEMRSTGKPKQEAPVNKEAPKPVKQRKLPPEQRSTATKPAAETPQEVESTAKKADSSKVFETPEVRHPKKHETPKRERPSKRQRQPKQEAKAEPKPPTPKKISGIPPQEIAEKFLTDIFGAMQLDIKVSAQMESEDALLVNLDGDNMGIVIGKRGDTLDSLQYLTSLVINQQTENYIKVTIDTENYREKRTDALLVLSNRLAEKVARTGKKFTLEPMSPYERRIIHSNLQESETVTTFSVGTEPYRKVVIAPKNHKPFRKGGAKKPSRPYKKDSRRPAAVKPQELAAEKKGSYTTTYKADFKPQQHKAEFKSFDDYLKAHEGE